MTRIYLYIHDQFIDRNIYIVCLILRTFCLLLMRVSFNLPQKCHLPTCSISKLRHTHRASRARPIVRTDLNVTLINSLHSWYCRQLLQYVLNLIQIFEHHNLVFSNTYRTERLPYRQSKRPILLFQSYCCGVHNVPVTAVVCLSVMSGKRHCLPDSRCSCALLIHTVGLSPDTIAGPCHWLAAVVVMCLAIPPNGRRLWRTDNSQSFYYVSRL
jgi:hypothetical protein